MHQRKLKKEKGYIQEDHYQIESGKQLKCIVVREYLSTIYLICLID